MISRTTCRFDHSEYTSVLPNQVNKLAACLADKRYDEAEKIAEAIADAMMHVRTWILWETLK
jgi:hypothetical protein